MPDRLIHLRVLTVGTQFCCFHHFARILAIVADIFVVDAICNAPRHNGTYGLCMPGIGGWVRPIRRFHLCERLRDHQAAFAAIELHLRQDQGPP